MKILVVEDEQKIANAIARGLRQEKYVVEAYNDGATGLGAALGDDNFDLMILDRMLPEVEGLEMVRQIRAAGIKVPILILTARGQIRDRVDGLNAGADDYLVKPFAFMELLARVHALLRRPQETQDNVLRVEDLMLDTVSYEVRRGKSKIKLSTIEFGILEYMMRNVGKVLSKEKLVGHVWDFDADVLPNTVEAHISALRRKIDKPFRSEKALIQTLRGFGYKIGVA